MHPLTEADVRASFVNAGDDELRLIELPHDFLLTDWDYLDFFAWRDPSSSRRGYVLLEHEGSTVGIVLQTAGGGRTRSGMCNICHTMQPGNQVALWAARRAGERGSRGDTVGTYVCADLSCHENVRLAHPLAPNEVLAPGQVDMRLDGTRRRMHDLVQRVLED
ncbi:FBP domain-containing protein [Microbacterium sp. KUDC0406]|uniref:FBP domain-containing protein n=1 Tax=Microbacterium sp. KUDC0406 TaxID=2909588 RepID=UPI001F342D78|nr:FBP domain-containing protein [Microbacterium sp. KUDC0406]UJP08945.1 FBP domain-containing protein [Microbacterium sp. KUDC0406]